MKDISFVEDQVDDMKSANNIVSDIATMKDNMNNEGQNGQCKFNNYHCEAY